MSVNVIDFAEGGGWGVGGGHGGSKGRGRRREGGRRRRERGSRERREGRGKAAAGYAMSGTDAAYSPTQRLVLTEPMVLRMSGTDVNVWCSTNASYGATQCLLQTQRMVLRNVWY